ncbi:MAG: protoheme IX farnesyltransferase [Anaerolineaceae bacterium]|nr:MAG: protoheme IX farnesyltransferase [Anaerolineaceae bacterium]
MASTVLNGDKLSAGDTIRAYLQLMKLRIVGLLCFTTLTAMFVAAGGVPDLMTAFITMIGGILASGGSSAINQYVDRDMDAKMQRTAWRPIPSGRIAPLNALMFGVALVLWSVVVLGTLVNPLAALMAFIGAIYYVVIYTLLLKRNTVVNILIGGGAGAFPVLVGWAAVQNAITFEALLLFAIVFYWTPPHSWALALLVNKDYTEANVPMMPVAKGEEATHVQIVLYSVQLFIISLLPVLFGVLGVVYMITAVLLGAGLIRLSIKLMRVGGLSMARRTYKFSTMYLALVFLAMIVDVLVV